MEGIDENVASNRDIGEIERRILDQVLLHYCLCGTGRWQNSYNMNIVCAVVGNTPTILCVRGSWQYSYNISVQLLAVQKSYIIVCAVPVVGKTPIIFKEVKY